MPGPSFRWPSTGQLRHAAVVGLGLLLALVALHLILGPRLLGPQALIGPDFAHSLPMLLEGYLWASLRGAAHLPLFSPAWCGGVPYLADPANMHVSLPQLFTAMAS